MTDKPLLRVLSGESVWPPPVWLMRQAGRHLPEYRAMRGEAGSFMDLCLNPELAAEVTIQPVRRYGMDGAILFSDILIVPWAMGQGLTFAEGEGPRLPPITDQGGVDRLDVAGAAAKAEPIMETVRRVKAGLAKDHPNTTLIGFSGSPWTVACYMVEGKGGGEFKHARRMIHDNPALFGALVEKLEAATLAYLIAQVDAGAEALMLFDSWAGQLAPNAFRKWVIEPNKRLRAAIKAARPSIPVIGFPRLAGPMLAEYAAETGVQACGMDTAMNPAWAAANVPKTVALQGNLDPEVLIAGGPALRREAESILAAMKGRPFIFNLGHGVEITTPPEHVVELLQIIRAA
ncbi:uroporphyrinogen decarboxylase [Roseococcus sp. SDR]|uniref:uroporphyrinogen decarboxylase n=1 Tax=Roseococcus sp. SDR TaxID=2835532 RepID=UPI001BD09F02|nr:uroporphyrinogen decarboxylase [Roseococcus sp. SDR]MBS7791194.1 uroporphyrinogen decarboxylase [Roseococcus sp. SDR]MBV1846508.1 uroporphyrinogen decarboxylase [Roseococcus sp. SDR]